MRSCNIPCSELLYLSGVQVLLPVYLLPVERCSIVEKDVLTTQDQCVSLFWRIKRSFETGRMEPAAHLAARTTQRTAELSQFRRHSFGLQE